MKSAVDAVVLGAVRELDVTNAPKKFGWASTQDFVTSIAGGTTHTGPALVRLANAVDQPSMASVGEAWRNRLRLALIEILSACVRVRVALAEESCRSGSLGTSRREVEYERADWVERQVE